MPQIQVIEDEEDIAELLSYNLKRAGYAVTISNSGERGMEAAKLNPPDLILLDLMLPGLSGLDVCRILKKEKRTAKVPVVMVTAKGEEGDVVQGLELGADDYVSKPFSPKVLLARVQAVLRRTRVAQPDGQEELAIHGIVIHPGKCEVTLDGVEIDLSRTEFRLLHFLAMRPGWVFTRSQIVKGVQGPNYPVTERSVDVQIVSVRKKLAASGDLIETVRGVGYRFKE